MAFSTKRVWISGKAKTLAPTGHGVQTAPASIGTKDIDNQRVVIDDIACSAAADTTAVAGFDDLLNTELVTKLDTLIGTTMGIDTSGNTVAYNFQVTDVERGLLPEDQFLNDATAKYKIIGSLEVAIS